MEQNLQTPVENTWCPGCGNFGILNAFRKAIQTLEKQGIDRSHLVISAGIGCHGKIFDYIPLSGLYSLHGRSMATVQGIKIGNPDLKVLTFAGDGDAFGEGISHMIFAAKRNADITVIVHNNGTYALTTGQFSPTSQKGFKGPSSPHGNVEMPLNPVSLMLEAGSTFVARGYAGRIEHLANLIVEAVVHEGFSYIDVLQPSVVFNNTYKTYNSLVEIIEKPAVELEDAVRLAKRSDRIPIGVFYKGTKPVYHKELMAGWNPMMNRLSHEARMRRIASFLSVRLPK
jgi:2-oxoglutarate/2-oxoacid ferredoxin oxidoreductase subunit beta